LKLQGKRIVVAGGATGIGAATAERLAAEGAAVVVGDLNIQGARATAERITQADGTAFAAEFDLADEDSVQSLVDLAIRELGGVDGLYNVGADLRASDLSPHNPHRDSDLLEIELPVWRRTFEVNLLGYVLTCRAVLPHLLRQGGGVIVNTSSGAGSGALPNRPAYSASKAGVESITRHIASRWGKQGIRCNAVSPGMVLGETQIKAGDTELHAQALAYARSTRLGRPSDLAAAVAFLFSDDAEWINGQIWKIDGGMAL
jgi:NAD(P)-dependent dehydrogenase (short-subunit alcohol dehydrogenase family)